MFEQILFALLAAGAVGTSALVVIPQTGKNPLYGALFLVLSFVFMAGLYVLLLAHLMAALQVLVYAGAIMVLFMFVIMLLNISDDELEAPPKTIAQGVGVLAVGAIIAKVALVLTPSAAAIERNMDPESINLALPANSDFGTTDAVGDMLFRQFLYPFELTSILLLVAVIGAVVLAKRTL